MSIIFTNHAEERMRKRKIARSDIERTVSHPDQSFPGKKHGTVKFIRRIDDRNHQVVAKLLENKRDWLVLSVWVRGEDDTNWIEWIALLPFRILIWIVKKILGKK